MRRLRRDEPPAAEAGPAPAAESGGCGGADPLQAHVARELPHDRPLICCGFEPTGRFAFAGSEDFTVRRWDLEAEEPSAVALAAHESWVFDLAFTPDGAMALSVGGDGRLIWWPAAEEGEPVPYRTIDAHEGWARGVAVSPDGALAATCGNDRRVRIWSVEDGILVHDLAGGHEKPAYGVAFHPGGGSLVSADLQGRLVEWDVATGEVRRRLDASALYSYNGGQQVDYGGVRDLAFSPAGDRLAAAGLLNASNPLGAVNDAAVVVFDWERAEQVALLKGKGELKGVAWGVRFHPDGFLAVAVGGSGGGAPAVLPARGDGGVPPVLAAEHGEGDGPAPGRPAGGDGASRREAAHRGDDGPGAGPAGVRAPDGPLGTGRGAATEGVRARGRTTSLRGRRGACPGGSWPSARSGGTRR